MKIVLISIMLMCFGLSTKAQTDSTRNQNKMPSSNYNLEKQSSKPETNAQKESGAYGQTETIQGKSGTQGQTQQQSASGTKPQNESGIQGETGTLQGKSGTQGQTTQGETSDSLQQASENSASTQTPNMRDTQYRTEDMTDMKPDMLPSSLRDTLQNDSYKGWQNGRIYYDKIKNEYLLEMVRENKRHTYRFDKHGKLIDEK
jgi:hypothetical protein